MEQELKHVLARIISIAFFASLTVIVVCSILQVPAVLLGSFCLAAISADNIVGLFVSPIKIEAQ